MDNDLEMDFKGVIWFDHWAQSGDSDFICSACKKQIEKDNVPVLFWTHDEKKIVRLHDDCFIKRAKYKFNPIEVSKNGQ